MPTGVLIILLACFGVSSLIGLSSVSFPASVALLIVLFFGLLVCDVVLGERRTRAVVNIIDIPVRLPFYWGFLSDFRQAGWALRYINIFFTPS